MPLVTVIMPAYNAAATIARAIGSVCAQPFADWSLIVVDDGSADCTADMAERAAAGDPRVEVLRNARNEGAAAAMNRAWRGADSRYVAVLDADDAALAPRLSAPVECLERRSEIAVLGGTAHFVDGAGRFLRTVHMPAEHALLARRRWYASPFVHPSVTLRREFLDTLGGYTADLRLGEDYDLWMRGFFHGGFRYANLREPLVIYTAKPVQRWTMIRASARVRRLAGNREGRRWRGEWAALRILMEGVVERTGLFAWRDRAFKRPLAPPELGLGRGKA